MAQKTVDVLPGVVVGRIAENAACSDRARSESRWPLKPGDHRSARKHFGDPREQARPVGLVHVIETTVLQRQLDLGFREFRAEREAADGCGGRRRPIERRAHCAARRFGDRRQDRGAARRASGSCGDAAASNQAAGEADAAFPVLLARSIDDRRDERVHAAAEAGGELLPGEMQRRVYVGLARCGFGRFAQGLNRPCELARIDGDTRSRVPRHRTVKCVLIRIACAGRKALHLGVLAAPQT